VTATSQTGVRITMVTPHGPDARALPAWTTLVAAWPDAQATPVLEAISADEILSDSATPSGAVVLFDPAWRTSPDRIAAVLDRLWHHDIPSVMLADECGTLEPLRTHGLLALPRDAAPATIAAVIWALAHRQRAYASLRRELGVAQRFQGGLTSVVNKLHEELRLAAAVQQEMLPASMPEVDGLEFRVFYRSAGYVSGDTYDVQRLDADHVGFFVADAVGHGVPAALMTMIIGRGMRLKQVDGGSYTLLSPGKVLAALNQDLVRHQSNSPRFATAVCGIVNTRLRRVTIAAAGHPAPLVVRPGAAPIPLNTDGSLLGVFSDSDDQFTEVTFTLEPDQLLVVYSDGFETAFPGAGCPAAERRLPTRNYLDRFGAMARLWHEDSLDAAMNLLEEGVDAQAGSLHQLDDLTALVIAPKAEAASGVRQRAA
jgi:serine phosphatase RsbU (regulator of sigma subunit)